jgi:cadmium resistance protein CadD (predicted permease)
VSAARQGLWWIGLPGYRVIAYFPTVDTVTAVGPIITTVLTAAGLFAGTNMDDMVVLAVLNVSSRTDGHPTRRQIWAGQYAGLAALVLISLVGALGLSVLPQSWVWLLGLIPLLLGICNLIRAIRAHHSGNAATAAVASGLSGVIGLTIANGGDNIVAYTPVFRTLATADIGITVVVFAVGVAVWNLLGPWLVSHPAITHAIQAWGHWIVPTVYILIGLYVFSRGGVLGR